MLSFRRSVSENLMELWYELVGIVEEIHLNDEFDQITWSFSSNGKFSVQSLYAVINHRGVKPVYVHTVWKLRIPPRVQIFLWLLSKNKLLTQDNLAKRRDVQVKTFLFCTELETICHCFLSAVWQRPCGVSCLNVLTFRVFGPMSLLPPYGLLIKSIG